MTTPVRKPLAGDPYRNDHRLVQAYREAISLDHEGLGAICPSYSELSAISSRYQDGKLLGKGGVKEVCRVFDNHTRRCVAMATLRKDRGPEFYDIFVNEAWLTSSLKHPNIINVHDVGIDPSGRPFFTMDLKGNNTLADLISSGEHDRNTLLRVFLKICDAIAYAHSQEIIHLDLKPANIQTDNFGEVLVCDWGLGKFMPDEEKVDSMPSAPIMDNMTLVGEIKGSPGYMAPEQVDGGDKDHRTDIFSLGCIHHAILTGKPPFTGDTDTVLEATSRAEVPDPCAKFPNLDIPSGLGSVTLKALAREPGDRYQTVSELRDDVQRYLDGFSTNAEDSNFLRETRLFVSRHRIPVLIASLALVLLSVLTTLFLQKVDFLNRSVLAESQLAERYASEAETANELYVETVTESKQRQRAIARILVSSAGNLKNKGVYDTPMKSIRQALVLAEHALALDPESGSAKYQIFALNLIQLNFQEALKYPPQPGHGRYGYMRFAEAFPDFGYDKTNRPRMEIFRGFLEKARELDPGQSPLLERMVSYDCALRSSRKGYEKVVLELVRYLNPDHSGITLECSGLEQVTLRSEAPIRLIADPGGSGECVLRYLSPRGLTVEIGKEFDLHELNGLGVHNLDLTNCGVFNLEKALMLPALENVTIDPALNSASELRKWIRSTAPFKIHEKTVAPLD